MPTRKLNTLFADYLHNCVRIHGVRRIPDNIVIGPLIIIQFDQSSSKSRRKNSRQVKLDKAHLPEVGGAAFVNIISPLLGTSTS